MRICLARLRGWVTHQDGYIIEPHAEDYVIANFDKRIRTAYDIDAGIFRVPTQEEAPSRARALPNGTRLAR